MEFSQEEFDEILSIFNDESDEIIHRLNNNILALEKNPKNKDIIIELFRDAHSLKGAARMIGFNDIQAIAHKIEDILGLAKEEKIVINTDVTDVIYKSIDFINMSIELSVKSKKEVKLSDYGKFIKALDEVIKPDPGNSAPLSTEEPGLKTETDNTIEQVEPKPIEHSEQEKYKTNESSEFIAGLRDLVWEINAKITEVTYLFSKITETADLNCILALIYDMEKFQNAFKQSENCKLKTNIADMLFKLEFVSKNTGILNKTEILDLKEKFDVIVDIIVNLFKSLDFPVLDYKQLANNKLAPQRSKEVINEKPIVFVANELISDIMQLEVSLEPIDGLISQIKEFIQAYKDKPVEVIFHKVLNILNVVKEQDIRPDSEVLNILKQSIHLVEKLVNDVQTADKEDIDLLLQSLDITEQMVSLKKGDILFDVPAASITPVKQKENKPFKIENQDLASFFEATAIKTLRVDTHKLDKLVNQIGEVIISKIKSQKNIFELENISNQLVELYDFAAKSQSYLKYYDRKISQVDKDSDVNVFMNFNKQFLSYWDELQNRLNEDIHSMYVLHKHMLEDDAKLNHVVSKLEQMVKDIRLLPLATVFHMIPRMVRDIAKEKNKEIELSISGSETSADKKIIEEIKTPLIHIIRNAIDHGIELPNERLAAGKPESGKIHLSARHSENKIIIEISDDGRGVNLEKIRQKAVTKGLLTFDEINSMTDEQIMNLIFWPGFSTEDTVTDISGRGIGLDIVQTKINQLNGTVKIQSIVGKGTRVSIELPVTMATIKSFIIKINSQSFAIPVSAIKAVVKVDDDSIYIKDGKENILYQQTSVPIFNLASVLGFEPQENKDKKTVLLIEAENNLVGFVVDELAGDQEILTKELAPPLFKLKNISGITTLINGDICLIINVSEVLKNIITNEYKLLAPVRGGVSDDINIVPTDCSILVVDDFMTTRVMLKNILSAKGYNVNIANDAIEAIGFISHNNYDVIVSDIEMPNMSGFELTKKIKKDMLRPIPVILISSLSASDVKQKAKEAGADLFISKNDFNQDYFLQSIEYLISKGMHKSDE